MSAFTGPQHKGAMRDRRKAKRLEAVRRNAKAKAERLAATATQKGSTS